MHGLRFFPAALAVLLVSAFLVSNLHTPWRVLLPALLPALVQGALLVWIERRARQPVLLAASFLSGAVVCTLLATLLNRPLDAGIGSALGTDRARALTPVVAAPIVEELVKGAAVAALLFGRAPGVDPVRAGIACGAMVGVGFAMTENMDYLLLSAVVGGEQHLWLMIYQRLLGSLNHPVFSATFGLGLGWALLGRTAGRRFLAVAVGAGAAIVQHVFWNGVTSRLTKDALCGPATVPQTCGPPETESLLFTVPLIVVASLVPGAVVVAAIALGARRRAAALIAQGRTS